MPKSQSVPIVSTFICVTLMFMHSGGDQWPDIANDPLVFVQNPIEAQLPSHWMPQSILKKMYQVRALENSLHTTSTNAPIVEDLLQFLKGRHPPLWSREIHNSPAISDERNFKHKTPYAPKHRISTNPRNTAIIRLTRSRPTSVYHYIERYMSSTKIASNKQTDSRETVKMYTTKKLTKKSIIATGTVLKSRTTPSVLSSTAYRMTRSVVPTIANTTETTTISTMIAITSWSSLPRKEPTPTSIPVTITSILSRNTRTIPTKTTKSIPVIAKNITTPAKSIYPTALSPNSKPTSTSKATKTPIANTHNFKSNSIPTSRKTTTNTNTPTITRTVLLTTRTIPRAIDVTKSILTTAKAITTTTHTTASPTPVTVFSSSKHLDTHPSVVTVSNSKNTHKINVSLYVTTSTPTSIIKRTVPLKTTTINKITTHASLTDISAFITEQRSKQLPIRNPASNAITRKTLSFTPKSIPTTTSIRTSHAAVTKTTKIPTMTTTISTTPKAISTTAKSIPTIFKTIASTAKIISITTKAYPTTTSRTSHTTVATISTRKTKKSPNENNSTNIPATTKTISSTSKSLLKSTGIISKTIKNIPMDTSTMATLVPVTDIKFKQTHRMTPKLSSTTRNVLTPKTDASTKTKTIPTNIKTIPTFTKIISSTSKTSKVIPTTVKIISTTVQRITTTATENINRTTGKVATLTAKTIPTIMSPSTVVTLSSVTFLSSRKSRRRRTRTPATASSNKVTSPALVAFSSSKTHTSTTTSANAANTSTPVTFPSSKRSRKRKTGTPTTMSATDSFMLTNSELAPVTSFITKRTRTRKRTIRPYY